MTSRLAIAAVALGCISAAGMGGFLAVRTATETSEAAPMTETTTVASPRESAAPQTSVAETPAAGPVRQPVVEVAAQPATLQPRAIRSATPAPSPTLVADLAELPPPPVDTFAAPPVESVVAPATFEPAPLPAAPRFDAVELASSTVIGIRLDTTVSSETARVEDSVRARVTRAVVVDGVTVVPEGAMLNGSVTTVERGGKIRERSRVGIRFTSVSLSDTVRVPIRTDAIFREGDSPTGEATAKIGASAVVGSILGGVLGGRRGAVIGGAAGAAGGTAMVVRGDANEAVLASGTALTVRLSEAATFEIER